MRSASHSNPELAQSADGAQFVVCGLAGQEYAIPAESVREVFRFAAVMPLPDSPPWVLGVIDVRGRVVPVVDGRRRLGLPEREDWLRAVVVLMEHERGREAEQLQRAADLRHRLRASPRERRCPRRACRRAAS